MPTRTDITVVNQAYDTSGNGGRKLVRLSNGWLVAGVYDSTNKQIKLFKSSDNGATWSQLCYFYLGSISTPALFSLASVGTNVYIAYTYEASSYLFYKRIDALTVTNTDQTDFSLRIDTGQTVFAPNSITTIVNSTGTELHAAWASKNSTYPNSFNIRYVKGTINADGSVTWGAVEQVTTYNNSSYPNFAINPTIVLDSNGVPIVIINQDNITISGTNSYNANSWAITVFKRSQELNTGQQNVHSSWTWKHIYLVNGYIQSSPSACVAPNGRIWVVWFGLDATDNNKNNIRIAYSDDGGFSWSSMTKLTSGNTVDHASPSITANKNNEIFVVWNGKDINDTYYDIRMIKYNGSWGSISVLASGTTADKVYPSTLYDTTIDFSTPLFIYKDQQGNKVGFYGTWTATTISVAPGSLGQKTSADRTSLLTYNITTDGTMGTITEKINGTTIATRTNPTNGQQFTVSLTQEQWDAIPYGKYAYRNLIPSFNSGLWNLHANAVVKEPYKLELNATAQWQGSTIDIYVFANKTYTFSMMTTGGYVKIDAYNSNNNLLSTLADGVYASPRTFTTPTNTVKLRITLMNNAAGTFTFTNPMLNEGTATKPFVPFGAENTLTIEMNGETWTYTFDKRLNANDDILSAVKGVQDLQIFLESVKSQLGQAIRAKGGTVNDTDPWSVFVSAVVTLGYVGSKRFAMGSAMANGNILTVTGLAFRPLAAFAVYNINDTSPNYYFSAVIDNAIFGGTGIRAINLGNSLTFGSSNKAITSNGFTMDTAVVSTYTWIAIG
jgi:hypothetical protein